VIWTEGHEPPFDIMYRRMEKRYEPMSVPAYRQTAHEKDFQLLQNYPNPFNNATNIPINIFRETQIEINIFNIDGRLVRKLASKNFPQGSLTISWDGKDNFHHSLSTGIYFVKVVSESYVSTEKIILVR
jgi:hypothetical protein